MGDPKREHETKKVVGLDLSLTATGVVVMWGTGEILEARTVGWKLTSKATVREKAMRWLKIAHEILEIIGKHDPDVIGIEEYAYGRRFKGEVLGELAGVVISQIVLANKRATVMKVAITRIRKEVFGSGSVSKDDIEKFLEKNLTLKDDNQRDAWAVAECVRRVLWVSVG